MREPMFKDVGVPSDEEFPDKIVFLPSTDSEELIRSESSAASGSGGFEYVSFKNVPAFRRLVGEDCGVASALQGPLMAERTKFRYGPRGPGLSPSSAL